MSGYATPVRLWARVAALGVLLAVFAVPAGEAEGRHGFSDVPKDHPFYYQIDWAAGDIVGGYGDGTYRPATAVTRQAMAVFLYRLAGWPDGPHPDPGFEDVDYNHSFYKEIAWAADAGIVNGYSDDTFRPVGTVTRQAAVAFIHRAKGEPKAPSPDPEFEDVDEEHPFFKEIAWAADQGITRGYKDGTFRPVGTVTRQAAMAFLFAADGHEVPDTVEELTVTFCDVGQADATIVQAGGTTMVVDAGHWQRSDVPECLGGAGVDAIDVLALTHPDADHIGQAIEVLDSYDVDVVWRTSDTNDSITYNDYDQRVSQGEADGEFDVLYPLWGDRLEVGALDVHVVHPEVSDDSDLSFRVRANVSGYGEASVLFTGDAGSKAEKFMLGTYDTMGQVHADVYQVGHHGSNTSTTQEFVNVGDFAYAVWSASEGNQYGHPHEEPIQRLVDADVEVYGTATHGTVVISADGHGWQVSTQTGAPPEEGNSNDEDNSDTPEGCKPGQIDVNSADHEPLQEIVHIGPDRASQIIDLRRNQPFSDLDDLERVDGLGPSRIQGIKDQGLACASTSNS